MELAIKQHFLKIYKTKPNFNLMALAYLVSYPLRPDADGAKIVLGTRMLYFPNDQVALSLLVLSYSLAGLLTSASQ